MNTSTLIAIKNCLQLLKQTESSANAILGQMQSISCTLPEYPVVRAMNGVGDKLAPRLIAEIGDIRRFTSARALNAYAGNDAPLFNPVNMRAKIAIYLNGDQQVLEKPVMKLCNPLSYINLKVMRFIFS